jgi:glycosyltransferase 2 family protein
MFKPATARTSARWLLMAVGPLLLVVVLVRIPNPERLLQICSGAFGWQLVLAFGLNFVAVALKVHRWQRLLATNGIQYSFRDAWNAYNASMYIGLLTPGRVGDVVRVAYLSRDLGAPKAAGFASIVVDRLFDIAVLGVAAAFAVSHLGSRLGELSGQVVWWSVGLALGAVPLFLLLASSSRAVSLVLGKLLKRADITAPEDFFRAARAQLKGGALSGTVLTTLSFAVIYLQGLLLARALHIPLVLSDVVAVNALATLFALFPVSVSGLGVREAFFAMLFPALGQSAAAAVGYGLLIFTVMYLSMVGYGFVVWQLHPLGAGRPVPRT